MFSGWEYLLVFIPLVIRPVSGGFRLFSKSTGKPLGPVRSSKAAVFSKDERRVNFFKNLAKSKGGKGSLRSKVRKTSLLKKV